MEMIRMIISNTPIWVWAVLLWGIWSGISSLRGRQARVVLLWIMPVVFYFLSIQSLVSAGAHHLSYVPAWILAVVIGGLIGLSVLGSRPTTIDRERGTLRLAPSVVPLLIFLAVFGCKYIFNAGLSMHPGLIDSWAFTGSLLCLSGLSTGIMTGRVALWYSAWLKRSEQLPA